MAPLILNKLRTRALNKFTFLFLIFCQRNNHKNTFIVAVILFVLGCFASRCQTKKPMLMKENFHFIYTAYPFVHKIESFKDSFIFALSQNSNKTWLLPPRIYCHHLEQDHVKISSGHDDFRLSPTFT